MASRIDLIGQTLGFMHPTKDERRWIFAGLKATRGRDKTFLRNYNRVFSSCRSIFLAFQRVQSLLLVEINSSGKFIACNAIEFRLTNSHQSKES